MEDTCMAIAPIRRACSAGKKIIYLPRWNWFSILFFCFVFKFNRAIQSCNYHSCFNYSHCHMHEFVVSHCKRYKWKHWWLYRKWPYPSETVPIPPATTGNLIQCCMNQKPVLFWNTSTTQIVMILVLLGSSHCLVSKFLAPISREGRHERYQGNYGL